jgi:nitrate reductase (NAD(P)H)
MMNNCWYRVRIHPCRTREGGIGLTFEHPTRPGNEKGGWMVKEKEEKDLLAAPAAVPVMKRSASQPRMAPSQTSYPMSEVKRHDSEKDAWIVVHNKVYNATKFLDDHPGGAESILINAGTDCTDEFEAIHR